MYSKINFVDVIYCSIWLKLDSQCFISITESIIDLILSDLALYHKWLDVKYVLKIWISNNLELRRLSVQYNNPEYKISESIIIKIWPCTV